MAYTIKFNIYPSSPGSKAGHVNVSFYNNGVYQGTFGFNVDHATNPSFADQFILGSNFDGKVFREDQYIDPSQGYIDGQTYLSKEITVSEAGYNAALAYAENALNVVSNYALVIQSCFTFAQDIFVLSGAAAHGLETFYDRFTTAERLQYYSWMHLGEVFIKPAYLWAFYSSLVLMTAGNPIAVSLVVALMAWHAGQEVLKAVLRDPLVLDLDGDGVEVTALAGSSVHFDYDQDGFAERTGWVSPDDGILVIDRNGNGIVDGAAELFGSATQDGFEVLETLDTNGDGVIDAEDEDFAELRIWQDADGDGVADAGELITLQEANIVAIELTRTAVNGTNNGHGVGFQANFIRSDQSTGTAQRIYFNTDRQETSDPTPTFTPAEGVEKLPDLPRSGQILSLSYVLSTDEDFRADWTELTDNAATMSRDDLLAEFEQLLLRWADVATVDSHGRGQYVDGRHLAFVEKFFGDTYREVTPFGLEVRTFPNSALRGAAVESTFGTLVDVLETAFLAQLTKSILARAPSGEAGAATLAAVLANPYFAYSLLDFRSEFSAGEQPPLTPGNLGAAIDHIKTSLPENFSASVDFLEKALSGLKGMVLVAFSGLATEYVAFMAPLMADIEDPLLRQIATEFASLTAREGTVASEGLVGDAGDNVLIGGKGDDGVDGKDGNDIYIYRSGDGHEWLNDTGPATDTDTLILTDLDPSDITLNRNGDDLLIVVTATGAIIEVNDFFKLWGTASNGIEQIRFADDTVWDRDDIKANTVFTGSPGNNVIRSAQDDVIHGLGGNDYIKIGAGRKEMARAISCGQPMFRRGPAELSCVR